MQIFILGKTKSGKSTLSQFFKDNKYVIYEAGNWAREEFDKINTGSIDEFSKEYKENLTSYALNKLRNDSYYSIKKYENFLCYNNENKKVIVGVRNPDDFLQMIRMDNENKVIYINSKKKFEGILELFEEGLKIIKDYLNWKEKLGNPIKLIEINEEDISNKEYVAKLLKDEL